MKQSVCYGHVTDVRSTGKGFYGYISPEKGSKEILFHCINRGVLQVEQGSLEIVPTKTILDQVRPEQGDKIAYVRGKVPQGMLWALIGTKRSDMTSKGIAVPAG